MKYRALNFVHANAGTWLVLVILLLWFCLPIWLQAQTTVVWREDFEKGWDSWSADNGVWDIGPVMAGPDTILPPGKNVAGTNLSGLYPPNKDTKLISPEITLPNVSSDEQLNLYFWQWHRLKIEDSYGPDNAALLLSIEGGSWIKILGDNSGYSPVWTQVRKGLTQYAGRRIRVAFQLISNQRSEDYGWYIDNLVIIKGPASCRFNFPEDFESGMGDWSVPGGLWEVGVPSWGSAHSGKSCAATVLKGNYFPYAWAQLQSPSIKLNVLPGKKPELYFFQKFRINNTDSYGSDYGFVQVSVKGGPWKTLPDSIKGNSDSWGQAKRTLESYADSTIRIAFVLQSNQRTEDLGWYIDDVRIEGISTDCTAPIVTKIGVSPDTTNGAKTVTLTAEISDVGRGDDNITQAEYYIDNRAGQSHAMTLNTVAPLVNATATILVSDIGTAPSSHWLHVRGKDAAGNWSDSVSVLLHITPSDSVAKIIIPDTYAAPSTNIAIPVRVTNWQGIAGAEIKLTYHASVINLESATAAQGLGITLVDTTSTGKCAIALARPTGLPAGGGTLFYLNCHVPGNAVIGDTTLIKFAEARFYDENTDSVKVEFKNGLFTVIPPDVVDSIAIEPPSAILKVNVEQKFIAKGYNLQKQPVPCSPGWSVDTHCGNIGTIDPSPGSSKSFTASGSGHGLIIAKQGTVSGSAIIVVGKTRGDINLDGPVGVPDAINCLQIIVGNLHPCPYQLWAADCDSSSGDPTIADAQCILHKTVNSMIQKKRMIYAGPACVAVGKLEPLQDGRVAIPILVQQRPDIAAAEIEICYDQSKLRADTVKTSRNTVLSASNVVESGLIKVASIDFETLVDTRSVWLNLIFSPKAPLSEITIPTIQQVRLFSSECQPVTAVLGEGPETPVLPDHWQLYQNHPNPFNPSTSIGYDLTAAAPVELQVYNAVGQFVATLVKATLAAGSHVAQWDGTDSAGHPVPAGVYFCRMTVDHGAWSKVIKMLLIK